MIDKDISAQRLPACTWSIGLRGFEDSEVYAGIALLLREKSKAAAIVSEVLSPTVFSTIQIGSADAGAMGPHGTQQNVDYYG